MDETFEEPEVENSRKYEICKTLQRKQNQPIMGSKLNRKQWCEEKWNNFEVKGKNLEAGRLGKKEYVSFLNKLKKLRQSAS